MRLQPVALQQGPMRHIPSIGTPTPPTSVNLTADPVGVSRERGPCHTSPPPAYSRRPPPSPVDAPLRCTPGGTPAMSPLHRHTHSAPSRLPAGAPFWCNPRRDPCHAIPPSAHPRRPQPSKGTSIPCNPRRGPCHTSLPLTPHTSPRRIQARPAVYRREGNPLNASSPPARPRRPTSLPTTVLLPPVDSARGSSRRTTSCRVFATPARTQPTPKYAQIFTPSIYIYTYNYSSLTHMH